MRFIFKIITVFCFLFGAAFASEVTFAFITDTNVTPSNAYKLKDTINEINSNKNLDFVVFGGCNIASPNADNLNYFMYLLKKVKKPAYVLLGSSDVSTSKGLDKDMYLKRVRKARYFRHPSKPSYVFKKKGNIFIVMDGSKQYFPQSTGCYTKEELKQFKIWLEKYKNENIIILQHFPVIEAKSKWLQTAKTENYYDIIKDYKNIKYIISGHYNENKEEKINGITHILTEKYSDSGAYRIITIDFDNNFEASYLIK